MKIEKLSVKIPLTENEKIKLIDFPGHSNFRLPDNEEIADTVNQLIENQERIERAILQIASDVEIGQWKNEGNIINEILTPNGRKGRGVCYL